MFNSPGTPCVAVCYPVVEDGAPFKIVYSQATPRRAREYVKDLGHSLIRMLENKNLPEIEAEAVKLVMFMHFERSLEGYNRPDKPDSHPDFREYAQAYTAGTLIDSMVSPEAAAIVRREFPPKPHEFLPDGKSEWSKFNVTRCPLNGIPCRPLERYS
ncbi:MAG: hypothetical protein LBC63_08310 [Holophagales bacterium]|nr:hypothetical protein [Holophagales bacterium]